MLPVGNMETVIYCATYIPMVTMYLHARMFCTLVHTSHIPMGAKYLYMQEHSVHSLIQLLYLRCNVFTCKNVLNTSSYDFYTHGCDVFTCKNVLYTHSYNLYTCVCNVFTCKNILYTLWYDLIPIVGTNFYRDNRSLVQC